MKIIAFIILMLVCTVAVASPPWATTPSGDTINNTDNSVTNNYPTERVYISTDSSGDAKDGWEYCTGTVIGLSRGAIPFDVGVNSLQWGVGGAHFDKCGAMSFSLADKLGGRQLLLNGGLSIYDGMKSLADAPINFGISGRF